MKPEDRIIAYLFAHKGSVQYSTMDLVVSDVKQSVFYGMSPIADDQIRQVIAKWATVHAVGLLIGQPSAGSPAPAARTPRTNSESELVDAVRRRSRPLTTELPSEKGGQRKYRRDRADSESQEGR